MVNPFQTKKTCPFVRFNRCVYAKKPRL